MDVADIPVTIIVGHVDGRRVARGSDVATRGGGGATQRHRLSMPTRCCPGFAGGGYYSLHQLELVKRKTTKFGEAENTVP
jgi:hypothetical protein